MPTTKLAYLQDAESARQCMPMGGNTHKQHTHMYMGARTEHKSDRYLYIRTKHTYIGARKKQANCSHRSSSVSACGITPPSGPASKTWTSASRARWTTLGQHPLVGSRHARSAGMIASKWSSSSPLHMKKRQENKNEAGGEINKTITCTSTK